MTTVGFNPPLAAESPCKKSVYFTTHCVEYQEIQTDISTILWSKSGVFLSCTVEDETN